MLGCSAFKATIDVTTCDVLKSCFRQPDKCSNGSCDFVLTWTYDGIGQAVNFEMEAAVLDINSWVAFGLSFDQDMVKQNSLFN